MVKKYILEIPKKVDFEDIEAAFYFQHEFREKIPIDEFDEEFETIPEEWLVEVDTTPLKPHELILGSHPSCDPSLDAAFDNQFSYTDMLKIITAAEENNNLAHKPRQSFDDFIKERFPNLLATPLAVIEVKHETIMKWLEVCYKWAHKNRGFDE